MTCVRDQIQGPRSTTSSPASSRNSRASACSCVSPGSSPPPGARPDRPRREVEPYEQDPVGRIEDDRPCGLAKPHRTRSRNAWNQRSRSAQGTAAFAGEVEGSTKRAVSPRLRSWSPSSGALAERAAVGLLADEADRPWLQLERDPLQAFRGAREVAAPEVAGAGGRPVRGVGGADPELQQLELLARLVEARREARSVQEPPEVVARVGEVGVRGGGDATGVDPAEDRRQPRAEDVRDVALRRLRVPWSRASLQRAIGAARRRWASRSGSADGRH